MWIALHFQRRYKNLQLRQRVPNAAHLERLDPGIVPKVNNHGADRLLAWLLASDQMQRQPIVNVGCLVVVVMVRGGQSFLKSTEFRNSVEFRPFFVVHFYALSP